MSLDRLLDGLDVAFEPATVLDHGRGYAVAGTLQITGGATVRFSPRRIVIVPPLVRARPSGGGGAADGAVTARARAERAWMRSRGEPTDAGEIESDAAVDCGRVRVTYQGSVGLFDHLREPLVVTLTSDDPLRQAFRELLEEVSARRPGYRAMAEALLRRGLIVLLRRLAWHDERRLSWLAPLEDSGLGRAVAAMQDRPEHAFTLPSLAEVAGMSRSVFAARFADALGQSPIGFLKTLRLSRATRLLLGTDLPVKSVATRVGYSSRSSFTRAFVACHGVGPTAFRAAAYDPPGTRGNAFRTTGHRPRSILHP